MARRILFFKQKKAYEIRIRDWSSDVCFPAERDIRIMKGGRELTRVPA